MRQILAFSVLVFKSLTALNYLYHILWERQNIQTIQIVFRTKPIKI